MERIRQKLLDERAGIVKSEEARRQRELKKVGKQVQVEKLKERIKGRKEMEERLKGLKRSMHPPTTSFVSMHTDHGFAISITIEKNAVVALMVATMMMHLMLGWKTLSPTNRGHPGRFQSEGKATMASLNRKYLEAHETPSLALAAKGSEERNKILAKVRTILLAEEDAARFRDDTKQERLERQNGTLVSFFLESADDLQMRKTKIGEESKTPWPLVMVLVSRVSCTHLL